MRKVKNTTSGFRIGGSYPDMMLQDGKCKISYPIYQTKKGNYYWHCFECGYTMFFASLDKTACNHNIPLKKTKNGKYEYLYCPICKIRVFIPIKGKVVV